MNANEAIANALRIQAESCHKLGSPLYASILDAASRDAAAGGIVSQVLAEYAGDSQDSVLALRFLSAVHRIALRGDAPALASCYPSCGGNANRANAWKFFYEAVHDHQDELRGECGAGVQTNEVNRCAALLVGFLFVAKRTRLPLRIFELGASAGLNLRWDRYAYAAGGWHWGSPEARLRLRDNFIEPPPAQPPIERITILERRGCDLTPLDANTPQGLNRLLSFVWPDQVARIDQLHLACEVAREVPVTIDRTDAITWLESGTAQPQPGSATVIFHSVFRQYLSPANRSRLAACIDGLGHQANADAPLAYMTMEPNDFGASVTLWPDRTSRLLATSSPHGKDIRSIEGS